MYRYCNETLYFDYCLVFLKVQSVVLSHMHDHNNFCFFFFFFFSQDVSHSIASHSVIQRNPVNTVTNEPRKFGLIYGVDVFKMG